MAVYSRLVLLAFQSQDPRGGGIDPRLKNLYLDRDSADDYGIFMADFFGDSKSQVCIHHPFRLSIPLIQITLDLDMFRQLYDELSRYHKAAATGDTDYIQAAVDFFAPLRKYDISAPCLSDVFHFFSTTYSYASTSVKSRQCENCSCSQSYNSAFAKYRWIFNGNCCYLKLYALLKCWIRLEKSRPRF